MAETVSDIIKHLASFGADGIETATANILSKDEESSLIKTLKRVSSGLGTPKKLKKQKTGDSVPTCKEVFANSILPQIRQHISRYEADQAHGVEFQCILDLNYKTNFVGMSTEEMIEIHWKITKQEETCCDLLLLIQFDRGCLYLAAYTLADPSEKPNDFFLRNFSVTYCTALRYICVASLIRKWPQILICGLSSFQLVKHRKNLQDYMASDTTGLSEKLTNCVELVTASRRITIESSEIVLPTLKKMSFDPDALYIESLPNKNQQLLESAKPFSKYMQSLVESDELSHILNPSSSIEQMTSELQKMKAELASPTSVVVEKLAIPSTATD